MAVVLDARTPLYAAAALPELAPAGSRDDEVERLRAAVARARAQLLRIERQLAARGLTHDAEIFSAHSSILADHKLIDEIVTAIGERNLSADAAVGQVVLEWYQQFVASAHAVVRDKGPDILDIGQRLLRCLERAPEGIVTSDSIVVAAALTPSDVVRFANLGVRALVVETCGLKSHVAILARGCGIPMIAAIDSAVETIPHGERLLVYATTGAVVFHASAEEQEVAKAIRRQIELAERPVAVPLEPVTRDGVRITLLLNISGLSDGRAVARIGADGVGLYRTEFDYLEHDRWPTEDEIFSVYQRVTDTVGPGELNIRLADFGAEKCPAYADIPINRNPSLGIRGMRLLLDREDILGPQARALARLARQRPLTVLLPMVDTADTLTAATEALCRIAGCRDRDELPFRLGAMIEVPSAAYDVDTLLERVDSLAVGLNDLTQYMLAADRDDELMEVYHDALQPAVLRIVARVIRAADAAGKPVTMCGELAGDRKLAHALLALGARRFSVSLAHFPDTVALIRHLSLETLSATAEQLLRKTSGKAVRAFLARQK
ncbi:MAG: phosphoenolpyruvate--protein phosphotransferase [Planctomycetales bacterium]|nr:phosphoenolpyruvate--protein phosphotransferase [Planctomycetales bacterium]